MGGRERSKGRLGEREAEKLLVRRGYEVVRLGAGRSQCDIVAERDGVSWAVEVKNRDVICPLDFTKQARANAAGRRWMVMARIAGTSSWLVLRQGMAPEVWR